MWFILIQLSEKAPFFCKKKMKKGGHFPYYDHNNPIQSYLLREFWNHISTSHFFLYVYKLKIKTNVQNVWRLPNKGP